MCLYVPDHVDVVKGRDASMFLGKVSKMPIIPSLLLPATRLSAVHGRWGPPSSLPRTDALHCRARVASTLARSPPGHHVPASELARAGTWCLGFHVSRGTGP